MPSDRARRQSGRAPDGSVRLRQDKPAADGVQRSAVRKSAGSGINSSMKRSSTKYHVAPTASGNWSVRRGDGVTKVFSTQGEAMAAAQAAARKTGGELIVRGSNGRVKKHFTLGRSAMERLNAVEGIVLSPRTRRTFTELDRSGAPSETRRAALTAVYRKAKS